MNILVIDDDEGMREVLNAILKDKYTVFRAKDGSEGLKIFDEKDINVVLLDLLLPDCHGLDVLKTMKEKNPYVEVIVISVVKDVDMVVKAMKLGAYTYITKEFDYDEVLAIVEKLREKLEETRARDYLQSELDQLYNSQFIIGKSSIMRQIDETIKKIASLPTTVLLLGETGTGKKLMARYIYRHSHLKDKPFVTLDVSTVPENLMESTLFGHEKGAFTGAHKLRYGKFELAHGGTLFLDEIGCVKYEIQSKLLRAIQDKEIERVGSTKTIKVDVRLIVATNVDLVEAVRQGRFREDLYYRINVIPIKLPPLRERSEDIPEFVKFFMKKYNRLFKKNVTTITEGAMNILRNYPWPGNIRELENLIARLVAMVDGNIISQEDIPVEYYNFEKLTEDTGENLLQRACNTFERNFILKVLEQEKWSRTRTAHALGIPISTLKYKFNKLNIYHILAQRNKVSRRVKSLKDN